VDTRTLDPYDEESNRLVWQTQHISDAFGRDWATPAPWEAARVGLRPNESFDRLTWGAFAGETMVGALTCGLPVLDNTGVAFLELHVLPDERRRGVGTALLEQALPELRAAGRTVVTTEVPAPAGQAGSAGVRFAERHGFTVALANDHRVVDLVATHGRWAALARECAPAHPGYRLVTWPDVVPEEHLAGYCLLQHAFNTEAPAGELEVEAERWDEERVRAREARFRSAGRHEVVTIAVAPDGSAAGLTEVLVTEHAPGHGMQGGTLVLPGHRGHRLGLALKVANQRAVVQRFPDCGSLHTWNAGVNAQMNAVNDRLGFTTVEQMYEMQRRL
jgi:GNAT superfamily N-acetyltransferase